MQAFVVPHSGAEASVIRVASPVPGPGEVLVSVRACGINFADLLMARGEYQEKPPFPLTLGLEIAGEILADPHGTGLQPGTRIAAYCGRGGLAEQAVVAAARCIRLPDAVPMDQAAALQVAYGTSHLALSHRARLRAGETLLVLGAAGGVGLTAVEIGKLMGARVIASARGADKLAVARAAGADHLIDSDAGDLRERVKDLGGADVVYDPVGGPGFTQALRATNPGGRILVIGFASGSVPPIAANHLLVKNIDVIGFYLGGYLRFDEGALQASLAQLLDWLAAGRIRPHISHRLPLARAADALELLRSRSATGKVVVELP